MDEAEYREGQAALVAVARMITEVDIPGMLVTLRHHQSTAPMLDPSLYLRAHADVSKVRQLLEAAMPLWHEAKRQIRAELEQREAAEQRAAASR